MPTADSTLQAKPGVELLHAHSECAIAPTRVLFLNTRDRCGADVAVHLSLMRHFDPAATRVFVLSNSQAGDVDAMRATFAGMPHVEARFQPLGEPADRQAKQGKVATLASFAQSLASLAQAAALVRRQRIQIIHATDRPRDAFLATLLGRVTRTVSVVHMHCNGGPHLSRLTLTGFRNATALFAVSEYTRRDLVSLGCDAAKIHVVHNATDTSYFDPSLFPTARREVRERYGIPADAPVIGIVARINPWKGQRELIEAVAQLTPRLPELRLLIIGGSAAGAPWRLPLEDELEALARSLGVQDRVLFLGHHADVRPLLASLDLFTHPSHEEPFGLAITEAMAMRLPVIACHSGGVPEIIEHGRNGWMVEPRSAAAVSEAIALLLADGERRRCLGERARETVRERFAPTQQSDSVSQIYHQLVAGR